MLKNNFPEDVVIEILSRLPAEALVRFKLVHKSWYARIQSSQFVAMQLQNHVRSPSSNNDNNLYLLVKSWNLTSTGVEGNILSLLTYDDRRQATSNGDDVSFSVKNVDLPFTHDGSWISSECDGIICLHNGTERRGHKIIIANPEIREFRAVLDSCIPVPIEDYGGLPEPCYAETIDVGFGFDLKTNDYKVVRILEFTSVHGSPSVDPQAEVYSLRSNSWRQIEYFDHCTRLLVSSGNYLSSYWNGVYYWPAIHCRGMYHPSLYGIASFDFGVEAFQFIAFPEHLSPSFKQPHEFKGIIVFHGTHALLWYPADKRFDIWLMDEVLNFETWTKVSSIGPILELIRPLAFWKSNEILVLLSNKQVASYNIVTNQMKNLPICSGKYANVEVVIYKSSLVSINRRNNL